MVLIGFGRFLTVLLCSLFALVSGASEDLECYYGNEITLENGDKICRCFKGYTGKTCQLALNKQCKFGILDRNKKECICNDGYYGRYCDRTSFGKVPDDEFCNGKNCSGNSTNGDSSAQGLSHGEIVAIVSSVLTLLCLLFLLGLILYIRKWWKRRKQRKQLKGLNLRAPYNTQTVLSLSPAVVRIANTESEKSGDHNSLLAASTSSQNALLDQNCVT